MRLKEDTSSWRSSGIQRRDFRHTANGPEVTGGKKRKKKDTKRWCRGVEGREHVVEVREGIMYGTWQALAQGACTDHQYAFLGQNYTCYHVRKCVECGKIMQEWLPKEDCPDAAKVEADG